MALLVEGGRNAVSTRAVCLAAGVQAPTLYRIFGDKQGLLDSVALHGFTTYLTSGTAQPAGPDPVADLRRGWDLHVSFGLANPYLYSLAYGDARPGTTTPAAVAAAEILTGEVHRVARAGQLRVPEDRAVLLLHAAGCGVTLTLIAQPDDQRDLEVSTLAREAVLAVVLTDPPAQPESGAAAAAVHLRATLDRGTGLSDPERSLLGEWLNRISAQAAEE